MQPSQHQAKRPTGMLSYFCQESCQVNIWTPISLMAKAEAQRGQETCPRSQASTGSRGRTGTQSSVGRTPGSHCSECGLQRSSTDTTPKPVRNAQLQATHQTSSLHQHANKAPRCSWAHEKRRSWSLKPAAFPFLSDPFQLDCVILSIHCELGGGGVSAEAAATPSRGTWSAPPPPFLSSC